MNFHLHEKLCGRSKDSLKLIGGFPFNHIDMAKLFSNAWKNHFTSEIQTIAVLKTIVSFKIHLLQLNIVVLFQQNLTERP